MTRSLELTAAVAVACGSRAGWASSKVDRWAWSPSLVKALVFGSGYRSTSAPLHCPRHDPYSGGPHGADEGNQGCVEPTALGRNAFEAHFRPLSLTLRSQSRADVGLRHFHAPDTRRKRGSDTAVWILRG